MKTKRRIAKQHSEHAENSAEPSGSLQLLKAKIRKEGMKKLMLIFYPMAAFALMPVHAFAQTDVRFTSRELDAAFVLMRPELNSIELDGQEGVFDPAPSLKYLGVDHETFDIDLGWIANIADLSFHHLKANMPEVRFQSGALQIVIPIADQQKAVQSRLGAISFKNVQLTANLGWRNRTDGSQALALVSTRFDGQLSGTGILRSSLILRKTKELAMKVLTTQVQKMISKPQVQDAIQTGFLNWAKFYTGTEYREIRAGSIQFFENGIDYQVQ